VRRICKECREETVPSTENLADLELTPEAVLGKHFYRGRGCVNCNNTGFKGRNGLFELLVMNDQLRDLVNTNASTDVLRDTALHFGMQPLRVAGLEKVYNGLTTIDEIVRETHIDA